MLALVAAEVGLGELEYDSESTRILKRVARISVTITPITAVEFRNNLSK